MLPTGRNQTNLAIFNGSRSQPFQEINGLVVVEGFSAAQHVAQVLHSVEPAVLVLRSRIIHKANLP